MKIDAKAIDEVLSEIETSKSISRDSVLEALKDAMTRAYKKELGGDDAYVKVDIDLEKGEINMCHVLMVVKEVEDDFLEISEEDACSASKKEYKAGDEFEIPASIETMRNATLMSIKSIMKQKFVEAERGVLFEAFKDKIGTMITGKVESCDDRGASVNIGRTSVYLPRKEMIGNEMFSTGDNIKLFVSDVNSGTKGAHIEVSRSSEGYLKSLFMDEIGDVYNGNIVIKSIARAAGERSKVAVYANDPNVDPAGACIGPNGSRIQKIVAQLGNGSSKENVDVIQYYDNPTLFICEALKPARIAGIIVDEEGKNSTVIVKDDSLSLAIGKKGVNARLAHKLTRYNIDIKIESDAVNEGLSYTTIDEVQSMILAYKAQRITELQVKEMAKETVVPVLSDVLPGLPEGYVAPQQRVYEDEKNDIDLALEEASEAEEVITPVEEEIKIDEKPVNKPANEEVKVEIKKTVPTTSLSDLEASLEAESKKASEKKERKNYSKKKKEEEESSEESAILTENSEKMSIYTEEELKEIAEEEARENDEEFEEEDIDYDEFDDYYDDEK